MALASVRRYARHCVYGNLWLDTVYMAIYAMYSVGEYEKRGLLLCICVQACLVIFGLPLNMSKMALNTYASSHFIDHGATV